VRDCCPATSTADLATRPVGHVRVVEASLPLQHRPSAQRELCTIVDPEGYRTNAALGEWIAQSLDCLTALPAAQRATCSTRIGHRRSSALRRALGLVKA